jgi:hypothetical protein
VSHGEEIRSAGNDRFGLTPAFLRFNLPQGLPTRQFSTFSARFALNG